MGLVNARNLRRAKILLDKNRHKVGDLVGKAAVQIDKASGGKTSDVTTKLEIAARKYSAGAVDESGRPVGLKPTISDLKAADPVPPGDVIDVDAVETDSDGA